MAGFEAQALELPGWRHVYSGKVRDLYEPVSGPADRVLVVASDRISAYDFVLRTEIPDKGKILTQLSLWRCPTMCWRVRWPRGFPWRLPGGR